FAALLLALAVRAIILPLAHKQIMWGRQMGQLKPYMEELKAKFTDKKTGQVTDQQAFTAETMKMYKEYGINPMAGCGPMLIQLPFFLAVYQCMLQYKFEFTKGSFLWIHPGSTQFLGIPLAPNLGEMDYILIAIYGVSMVVATLLQPITDPANAKQQRLMGLGIAVFFSIMMFFWPLPSAFVVYWTFTNILSTAQSLITYRLPLPPLTKVATVKGGSLPIGPAEEGGVKVDKFKGAKQAMPKKITPKKKTPKKP
ncbi:MAG: YidC/Oxa1 family membrane protein insertase, partial [Fimbriimonadaceae bacterium]|nr:YidC/Oxa1 family membrane protein insertase [Fimbriimonadaceae bacterium]